MMAFKTVLVLCLLFTSMHNADGTLNLEVNPTTITPGLTWSLTVNCSFRFDDALNMSSIISLIVVKENQREQATDLVSLTLLAPDQVNIQPETGGTVYGHLDIDGESFISIEWSHPTLDNAGLFRCEVHGMDNMGHPTEMFQTSLVTSQEASLDQCMDKVSQHKLQLGSLGKNQSDEIKKHLSLNETQSHIISSQQSQLDNQSVTIKDLQNKLQAQGLLFKDIISKFYISSEHNSHYYLLSKQDWNNDTVSAKTCQDYGGYLVQINNNTECQFVKDFLNQFNGFENVLISGTDVQHEGRWTYTDTDTDLVFYDWRSGDPDGGQSENCVTMYKGDQWRWNSWPCKHSSKNRKFLCELVTL